MRSMLGDRFSRIGGSGLVPAAVVFDALGRFRHRFGIFLSRLGRGVYALKYEAGRNRGLDLLSCCGITLFSYHSLASFGGDRYHDGPSSRFGVHSFQGGEGVV